ncbi:YHS domain-containing protein [Rhodopirellula rubra]|uniref:YHS domain-containing protein n=1 Tax=Aporhodopirellula rubra TaxID=980271 RepID=A0A7W5H531_9BACT|nr:hypothetical protein [Aporhodopirellula rubra]MBB3205808.1 YHS domain-containing protein [Aporhodopirellula rubra]
MKHTLFSLALLGIVVMTGCNSAPEELASQALLEAPPSEEILAALVQADKLDGTEDHVIGKCYVCQLGMNGKPEFTTEAHGYTAHMCSSYCRDHFTSDPDEVISNTEIPAKPENLAAH